MASLTTSVERLSASKVRLHVAVPEAEFEKAIDAAFRRIATEVKIPGFRPGKAPRRLLEARFGNEVARERALRDSLPGYYDEAVQSAALDAIAVPEIDITAGSEGGDVEFDAVVEVRPVVELEGYDGLRVEVPRPVVADDAVDHQVNMLRERFADLEESSSNLIDGSYAEIDIKGSQHDHVVDAATASDFLYEVGSGLVVEELDEQLRGKRAGDILQFNAKLPERFGERAGEELTFRVLVKATKRKVLPEVTDEWVSEVSEFETVDAFRADVRNRLELVARFQTQLVVRDKALEAIAALVDVEIPDALVNRELERRVHDVLHQLERQHATVDQYLAATGQDQETFLAALRGSATEAVRADLALRAVVAREHVEVTDEELEAEIARLAQQLEQEPRRVRRDLERRGAVEAVRFDLARGKALRLVVDRAQVVGEDGEPIDLTSPGGEAPPDEAPSQTATEVGQEQEA